MSPSRQIVVLTILIAIGAAGWLFVGRDYLFGDSDAANGGAASSGPPGARQGGGPPGGPPGRGGPRGGFGRGAALVVTAPVEIEAQDLEIRAVGTARAVRAITVFPEVSGVVAEVALEPDTMVTVGDVLLRLNDGDQAIALERAQLAVSGSQAAFERAERLAESNNITDVALTDARADFARAEIDLREAELELAKRMVRAPFAGRVGLTDLVVGDLVNSTTAVTTLDDLTNVIVAFDVPERATGLVSSGKELTATAEALPGVTFEGRISEVDSRVDDISRTLRVRALLPNAAAQLKPGMAVTVMLTFPGEERPSVPSLAVQWDREGPYVWEVVDGSAQRTGVDIVSRRSGSVSVIGELAEGDPVVVEGLQRLRNGASVRIAGAPPAGAREGAPANGDARPEGARRGPPGAGAAVGDGERRQGPRAGQGRPEGRAGGGAQRPAGG